MHNPSSYFSAQISHSQSPAKFETITIDNHAEIVPMHFLKSWNLYTLAPPKMHVLFCATLSLFPLASSQFQ